MPKHRLAEHEPSSFTIAGFRRGKEPLPERFREELQLEVLSVIEKPCARERSKS